MSLPTTTDLSTLIIEGVKPIQHFKIAGLFQEEFDELPAEFQNSYEYDPETRQYALNELEWLKWRKHGPFYRHPEDARYIDVTLGGSDIAVLFEGSKLSERLYLYDDQHGSNFKCSIELFCEKTGRKLELNEKKNADILWTGHNEEPSIRALFKKKFQDDHPLDIVNVINDCHMYQCGIRDDSGKLLYPFVLCDLDGLVEINGITGVLECKTCNRGSEDFKLWKSNIVPLKYYLQVCWYMLCMNLPYAYVCVKWGLSTSECRYIYIERNFEVEQLILEMAIEFIGNVRSNTPPELNGQNIKRLFTFWRRKMGNPKPDAPQVRLDQTYKDAARQLLIIEEEIKSSQNHINALKEQRNQTLVNDIFPLMGDASEAVVDYSSTSNLRICLKPKQSLPKLDLPKLADQKPDLYKLYLMQVEKFDTKSFLNEQKEYLDDYTVIDDVLTETKMEYCKVRLEPKQKGSAG